MTDFPDRNLDHLRARVESGRPDRSHPIATGEYEIGDQIPLPVEPRRRDIVIEALNAEGGMEEAYWPYRRDWTRSSGPVRDTEDRGVTFWLDIVQRALAYRWTLVVRKQGPESTPDQLRAAGR